jgi:ADP-ribosyl-[dinitrogen reductase] hydrolase
MLGAIVGDVAGSTREFRPVTGNGFETLTAESTYTDETVLTVAVADCLLHGLPYAGTLRAYTLANPGRAYATRFTKWIEDPERALPTSYSNGAAGRVSPVGWAFTTLEETLAEATRSALPTHGHPDGIAGAQAVAASIFMARNGSSRDAIREYIEATFGYDLRRAPAECVGGGLFEAAELSVPEAIICFLSSADVESAIRAAISLCADADSQAAIAGSIAEAFYYGVPAPLAQPCVALLPAGFRSVLEAFRAQYRLP